MSYKYLEDVAVADVAFEATGKTLGELFESAGLAVTNVMVKDLKAIDKEVEKEINVSAENAEKLLFNFLQEIIFYKDAEQLLLSKFEVDVGMNKKTTEYSLRAKAWGEKIDMKKHDLIVDVKAVTYHQFELKETEDGWAAIVILDI